MNDSFMFYKGSLFIRNRVKKGKGRIKDTSYLGCCRISGLLLVLDYYYKLISEYQDCSKQRRNEESCQIWDVF